jgi:hypothetical protein
LIRLIPSAYDRGWRLSAFPNYLHGRLHHLIESAAAQSHSTAPIAAKSAMTSLSRFSKTMRVEELGAAATWRRHHGRGPRDGDERRCSCRALGFPRGSRSP